MKSFTRRKIVSLHSVRPAAWAVVLLFVSMPFDTFEPIAGVSLLRLMALPVVVLCLVSHRSGIIERRSPLLYLCLFTALMLATLPFSVAMAASASRFITFAMYALLLFAASGVAYTDVEKNLLKKAFIASAWMSVLLLLFFYYSYEGRMTIAFNPDMPEDPNQFCGYLLPGLIYYFYQLYVCRRLTLITVGSFLLFLSVVLLSGSRGGLLAGAVGMLVIIAMQVRNTLSAVKHSVVVAGITGLLVVGVLYMLPAVNPIMATRFSLDTVLSGGGTGRLDLWQSYLGIFQESPPLRVVFGYGAGSLSTLHGMVAHNNWVEVLLEAGVVGVLLYAAMIVACLKVLWRHRQPMLFAIFVSYMALTLSLSLFSYKPLWGMMVLVLMYTSTATSLTLRKQES